MKYKYNGQWVDVNIKALDSMPIGSIILFSGETIPTGWMICDGSELYVTATANPQGYPEIFDVIGTKYGTGTAMLGKTTFLLPDLRGKVPVGLDSNDTNFDTLGETGGSKYLQAHEHNVRGTENNTYEAVFISNNATNVMTGSGSGYGLKISYAKAISAGSGDSGNLQPYITLNYIIKVKNTTPTMASIVDDYSTSTQDGYSCNYFNDCNAYSTTEINTGKTWIDGKPIYRKVIQATDIDTEFSTGVSNIDKLWFCNSGSYIYWSNDYFYEIGRADFYYQKSTNKIKADAASVANNWSCVLTIEYTKTTD